MILTDKIKHQYDVWQGDEKSKRTALDGVSIDVAAGEFLAILGANGSGKSTLAKHLNVLLLPDEGVVLVDGKDTADEKHLWEIRTTVGMVFQNPDNQIIGTSVEEDVAFGPENRSMEPSAIKERVADSLRAVGLLSKRKVSPYRLSGGQKQRVAVAGVLAADSACIVLDEPTAMLDPVSRRELMEVIQKLHEDGRTIILITHHTDEAALADRLILMDHGRIAAQGTPAELFRDPELLRSIRMDIPPVTELASMLSETGVIGDDTVLTKADLIARVLEAGRNESSGTGKRERSAGAKGDDRSTSVCPAGATVLEVKDLHYTYSKGEINETPVLKGVSFTLHEGECIGLIGTSGSGKTTLAKNLNGLLRADSGDVLFRGESIFRKGYKLSGLRREVGLVFQNPETQLFCKTVLDDVMFGPRRMGMNDEEALSAAKEALSVVDIGEEYHGISPMDLSGGQKRRVALAGVLAMNPSVLILDEPAAGLDPGMKAEIFGIIEKTRRDRGTAVLLVSHEMEDIVRYTDRVMLMSDGTIALEGTPAEVFTQVDKVRDLGADVPAVTEIMHELGKAGLPLERLAVTTSDAAEVIASAVRSSGKAGEGGGR